MGRVHDDGLTQRNAAVDADDGALLPRAVRRWVIGGVIAVMALAGYLFAVRGTAILFDLKDAVSAFCF